MQKGRSNMKVAFFSNYLNHHQLPFCLAMNRKTNGQFTFVATTPIPNFRVKLGYRDMNREYPFVLTTYDNKENAKRAMQIAVESDAIIIGSAPECYIRERIKHKKLTFEYSERIYKSGIPRGINIVKSLGSVIKHHTCYIHLPVYMLCASCYTARDFALSGAYIGKTYKWGYFPETHEYNIEDLLSIKGEGKTKSLLWVGRLIDWKHPDDAIKIAKELKDEGYEFQLNIIGQGPLMSSLQQQIHDLKLQDCVHMMGSMSPELVRKEMEKSNIYLFTSDFHEGWGAVLNESMNSACAVVASHAIGSAGFLIQDGKNGLIYKNGDMYDLHQKVKYLLDNTAGMNNIAKNAYLTIENTWNAEIAAERLIKLSESLLSTGKRNLYADGPCSKAKIFRKR